MAFCFRGSTLRLAGLPLSVGLSPSLSSPSLSLPLSVSPSPFSLLKKACAPRLLRDAFSFHASRVTGKEILPKE